MNQINPSAKTDLFLTQEIGAFFSDALRLELGRSGYQLDDLSNRIISGSLTRFYLDWRSGEDRSFELATVLAAACVHFWCTLVQNGVS